MYKPVPVEERIQMGLDPAVQGWIEGHYGPITLTATEKEQLEYLPAADRNIILDEERGEKTKQWAIGSHLEIRQALLDEPYLEHGEVYERLSPGSYDPRKYGEIMIYGQLTGVKSLSFKDHDTRIYPLFQFEDEENLRPFSTIAAVNLIKGMAPCDLTTFGNVYWWHLSDNIGAIENHVPYADKSAKELLQSPNLHAEIIRRAIRQRTS